VVIYEPKPDEPVVPPEITTTRLASKNPNRRPWAAPEGEADDADSGGITTGGGAAASQIRHRRRRRARGRRAFAIPRCRRQAHHRGLPRLLKDDIRKALPAEFGSLDRLPAPLEQRERKQAVLEELAEHGVPLDILQQAVPTALTGCL
jgi:type I restriction enzyme R subunit